MNTNNPTPSDPDTREMERILDKLGKAVAASPRGYGPASAYHEAITALQALQDKKVAEALAEHERNLNRDVLKTFLEILTTYGWEYGEDVKHDKALFRIPNKILRSYEEDPQRFFEQLTNNRKGE